MTGKRCLWFGVIVLLAGLSLYCGADKGTEPEGSTFVVELEHYESSFDDPEFSELDIRKLPCSTASNDSSVYGLDIPGEWIRVPVNIPEDGSYVPHLMYASNVGDVIKVKLEMEDCGSAMVASFVLNAGTGTS